MSALVYLHGFASGPGGSKGSFCRRWAEARGVPFLAPDLNLPSFEALTVSAQVAAVEALARDLAAPPVLVGSSLGGFVAAALAARGLPLARMVLLAPAFGFARRRLSSPVWEAYRRRGEAEVFHYAQGRPLRLGPALGRDLARWTGDEGWTWPVPTAILHGRADDVVPASESEAAAARNPGTVRLHLLEDDHALLAPGSLACLEAELDAAFSLRETPCAT